MDTTKFKDVETKYRELKAKLDAGEINAEEMKIKLKKLMVLDEKGNYWMIGGKSGKWYTYNGEEWLEDNPYKGISIDLGESAETQRFFKEDTEAKEKDRPEKKETIPEKHPVTIKETKEKISRKEILLEDEESAFTICKSCKSKISPHNVYCQICGANQKELAKTGSIQTPKLESELLIKSINIVPLIFFLGGLGLILGVIFGATFGIFNILGDLIYQFPVMLQETRGKIQGGLIFAAMGGICGFVFFALVSIIISGIYNAISFFFGGIRFKVKS